jgi:uncharacterized damage-inducible protein DinB
MIPLTVFRELYDYNYWARDRQLKTCAALTEEQFLRPMGNSFPSLRDTLAHLVGVEWLWLERWSGRSPRTLPGAEEFPTLAAIEQRWKTVERGLRRYLGDLSDQAIALPVTYTNLQGESWTYPLWRMLYHLLNHQSYHRGQVTTLLRQLGVVSTGWVDYLVALDARFEQ